jgi:hypothetical protein
VLENEMARDNEVSDRERVLEVRLAALEAFLARMLARNPEYLSELYLQNIPLPASIPSGRTTSQERELNLWNALSKLTQDFDKLTHSLIEERDHTASRISQLENILKRESAYVEILALISEHDAFSHVPMNRVLSLSIYLKEGEDAGFFTTRPLVDKLFSAIGFSVFLSTDALFGSFFDKWFGRSDDPITKEEVFERLAKLERALELKGIEVPQSEATLNLAKAAKELMESVEKEEEAAVVVGSLCVLKKGGKAVVVSLSQEQMLAIRKDPNLLRSPSGLQELIFGPATKEADPRIITAIEKPKGSPGKKKKKDWQV